MLKSLFNLDFPEFLKVMKGVTDMSPITSKVKNHQAPITNFPIPKLQILLLANSLQETARKRRVLEI